MILRLFSSIFKDIVLQNVDFKHTQKRLITLLSKIVRYRHSYQNAINHFYLQRSCLTRIFVTFQNIEKKVQLTTFTSMTSLLTHTVAHSTRPSFRPKTNNQPLKKFLSLAVSWVKVVKNCKILTFKFNFLCQKLSESF